MTKKICFAPVHASLCIWQTKMTWSPLFLMRTSSSALHWAGLWLLWPSRPHSWSRFWRMSPILDQEWGLEGHRSHSPAQCSAEQEGLIRNKGLHAILVCQIQKLACSGAKHFFMVMMRKWISTVFVRPVCCDPRWSSGQQCCLLSKRLLVRILVLTENIFA